MVNVHVSGSVALFEFIVSGLDSCDSTVVTYSLTDDSLLGQIALGEGSRTVTQEEGGGFTVADLVKGTLTVYDDACREQNTLPIASEGSQLSFAVSDLENNRILYGDASSGKVFLLDTASSEKTAVSLPDDIAEPVGIHNGSFIVSTNNQGIYSIDASGTAAQIFSSCGAKQINRDYAADIKGDYMVFLLLDASEPIFTKLQDSSEFICAADGVTVLSHSQTQDRGTLYFYNTAALRVTGLAVDGTVASADVAENGTAVAAVRKTGQAGFSYAVFNPAEGTAVSISSEGNGWNTDSEIEELPEPAGSEETIAQIRAIEEKYGVRVMFDQKFFFDIASLGYSIKETDESTACEKMSVLEKLFAVLPESLWKEIGGENPAVIYLCDELKGNVCGLNLVTSGYNLTYLTVTGSDDFFLATAAHECGHALERKMSPALLSGWVNLMPEEVQKAGQIANLTVEYTPDDKGRTPVWYFDYYSMTSEMEDRAVVFAHLFDCTQTGKKGDFSYDGLRKKADYWSYMLRGTYASCKNVTFSWESILNQ